MEPGFTRIVHPELGPSSISEVPESSLPQYYMGGWRLLAEDEVPPVPPLSVPEPVTEAEVTAAADPPAPASKKEK